MHRPSLPQKAHRLYAYEPDKAMISEFRINRIEGAKTLPNKFAPEAHVGAFDLARVRLSENTFVAYSKSIIPDDSAKIERLEDGGAILSDWIDINTCVIPDAAIYNQVLAHEEAHAHGWQHWEGTPETNAAYYPYVSE